MELVERALDAFNRRDLDAFLALVTADYEWFPSMVSVVEGGSFSGREGIEADFRESERTWDELGVIGEEFRDLGERVVVLGRTKGNGRGSGIPVHASIGMIVELRDGRMCRVRAFLDHDETLRAAGLKR